MIKLALALILILITLSISPQPAQASDVQVRTTYYLPTGNTMRSGDFPFWGSAACDWSVMPEGSQFLLNGELFTCLDTGSAVIGWHVDIFAWSWSDAAFLQSIWGAYNYITVTRWGY